MGPIIDVDARHAPGERAKIEAFIVRFRGEQATLLRFPVPKGKERPVAVAEAHRNALRWRDDYRAGGIRRMQAWSQVEAAP